MKEVIDGGFQILSISPRERVPASTLKKQTLCLSKDAGVAAVKVGVPGFQDDEIM